MIGLYSYYNILKSTDSFHFYTNLLHVCIYIIKTVLKCQIFYIDTIRRHSVQSVREIVRKLLFGQFAVNTEHQLHSMLYFYTQQCKFNIRC